jgi:glutamyl-tRNA reductase
MGAAISKLQTSLDGLNGVINTKIEELVQTTVSMKERNEKESKAFELILRSYGDSFLQEINRLKSDIGLKDLDELIVKLKKISDASEDPLKPENVDVLLDEVLKGIRELMGSPNESPKSDTETKKGKEKPKGQSIQPEGFDMASPPSK